MLEIIPIDMERKRCETIASNCLRLLLKVTWRDATTKMPTKALKITNEVQINVEVGEPNYPKE